jgi:LuxR family maltose regulon positive regulatory protein
MDSQGKPLQLAGIAYVPLAILHYSANDLTQAREYALTGQRLSQHTIANTVMGGDAELVLAQVHFALGETEEAITLVRATREAARQARVTRVVSLMSAAEADLCLRAGDIPTATQWARSTSFSPDDLISPTSSTNRLLYARLLMAQNRWPEAKKVIDRFESQTRQQGRHIWLIQVHIFQAIIARQLGDTAKAACLLEQAVSLAAPEDYCRMYLDHAQPIIDLLPDIRQVAPEFVDKIMRADRPDVELSSKPPGPLSDQDIKVLKLIEAGKSNQEIGDELFISVGTAKWHVHNILQKLGVNSRTQAIAQGHELGLI